MFIFFGAILALFVLISGYVFFVKYITDKMYEHKFEEYRKLRESQDAKLERHKNGRI